MDVSLPLNCENVNLCRTRTMDYLFCSIFLTKCLASSTFWAIAWNQICIFLTCATKTNVKHQNILRSKPRLITFFFGLSFWLYLKVGALQIVAQCVLFLGTPSIKRWNSYNWEKTILYYLTNIYWVVTLCQPVGLLLGMQVLMMPSLFSRNPQSKVKE